VDARCRGGARAWSPCARTIGTPATSFINEGLASALISERFRRKTFLYPWTGRNNAQIPPDRR
jgi:hypothetical protein